ncbi:MAG TPA: WYL domain-containing protein, partial [Thermoanaerobaculia bacterium]
PPELLGLFERAFTSHKGLAFDYRDREGRSSTRRIEPHGLLVEPPVWYILARDRVNAAPRMFRMDRVSRPRLAPDVEFVPDSAVIDALVPHVVRDR